MRELDSIKLYLKEIGDIPILSDEKLSDLISLANKGNIFAKQKVIESNLKLVVYVAKKYLYKQKVLDLLDLIGEGTLGLIKAVEKFKPPYGYRFSTYAYWWIKQSIQKALLNQVKMIYIPSYTTSYLRRTLNSIESLHEKLDRPPNAREIAGKMNTSVKKIEKILKNLKIWENIISLDKPIDENEEIFLKDIIISKEMNPEDKVAEADRKKSVERILKKLNKREQNILECRCGMRGEKPFSLSELAKKYRITRERVRQVEKRALEKMKQYLFEEGIETL